MSTPTDFELAYFHKIEEIEGVFEDAYPDMHDRDEKLHIMNALGITSLTGFQSRIDPAVAPYIPSVEDSLDVVASRFNLGIPFKVKMAQIEGIKAQLEAEILTEEQAIQALDLIQP